ncbi:MAG: hypothetical protein ABI990_07640 [Actinomycetota bacterium]
MPSRKQKRREAKSKRHEYEFVYVDGEGNELDEVPEELIAPKGRRNGSKADPAKKTAQRPQARGSRSGRTPQPPSWRRSLKRAAILGAVVFVFFSFFGGKGSAKYAVALQLTAMYTLLFVPFTYAIDRFAYRRWQVRQDGAPAPKKR